MTEREIGLPKEVIEPTPQEIVQNVIEWFGTPLVTIMTIDDLESGKEGKDKHLAQLSDWRNGVSEPDEEKLSRFKTLNGFIKDFEGVDEGPETIRAFFQGSNQELGDQSSALVIREDPEAVARAVRLFVLYG